MVADSIPAVDNPHWGTVLPDCRAGFSSVAPASTPKLTMVNQPLEYATPAASGLLRPRDLLVNGCFFSPFQNSDSDQCTVLSPEPEAVLT